MIEPYQDFQDQIIRLKIRGIGGFSSLMSRAKLEEEQVKFRCAKGVHSADTRLRYCTLKEFHLW